MASPQAAPPFAADQLLRHVPTGRLAKFGEPRANNQALIYQLDASNGGWEVGHARLADLTAIADEAAAGAEIEAVREACEARMKLYMADTTIETCPFKDCPNCQHRFCGVEDCQDGSTPSGGAWSVKCTSAERCAHERHCRWCDQIRQVGNPCYGGTGVCCQCRLPRGPWTQ